MEEDLKFLSTFDLYTLEHCLISMSIHLSTCLTLSIVFS